MLLATKFRRPCALLKGNFPVCRGICHSWCPIWDSMATSAVSIDVRCVGSIIVQRCVFETLWTKSSAATCDGFAWLPWSFGASGGGHQRKHSGHPTTHLTRVSLALSVALITGHQHNLCRNTLIIPSIRRVGRKSSKVLGRHPSPPITSKVASKSLTMYSQRLHFPPLCHLIYHLFIPPLHYYY